MQPVAVVHELPRAPPVVDGHGDRSILGRTLAAGGDASVAHGSHVATALSLAASPASALGWLGLHALNTITESAAGIVSVARGERGAVIHRRLPHFVGHERAARGDVPAVKVLSRRSLLSVGLVLAPTVSSAQRRAPSLRVLARLEEVGPLPFGCGDMVASSVSRFAVLSVLAGTLDERAIDVGFFCSAMNPRSVGRSFELELSRAPRYRPGRIVRLPGRSERSLLWSVSTPVPR